MPVYKYISLDLMSKKVKGKIVAENSDEMIKQLRSKQLTLISYYEIVEENKQLYKLKANEVADFSQEISTMLGSGITIIRALEIMIKRDIKDKVKDIYKRIYNELSNGKTLSEALESQENVFPHLFINMYKTGEESGHLDVVAAKMATHYIKEHKLNIKIKSATMYPKILMTLLIIVVLIIFTVILPNFFKLFEGIKLPLITKIIVAISNTIIHNWLFIIIGAILLFRITSYNVCYTKLLRVDYLIKT